MRKKPSFFLKKYYPQALKIVEKEYQGIRPNLEKIAVELLSVKKAKERVKLLEKHLGENVRGKKILEIGSGLGLFLSEAAKSGAYCWGVEPDRVSQETSLKILKDLNCQADIKREFGEKLSFANDFFDLVVSFQTLEHVRVPEKVIQEALTVLKPDGKIYFVIPNYNSFWEGHYEVFWVPYLMKFRFLAKIYLRLLKKDPKFLNTLRYITPDKVASWVKINKGEVLGLGEELWERRLKNGFTPWGGTLKVKSWVRYAKQLRLLSLISFLGKRLKWYYPIILIAQKSVVKEVKKLN